MNVLVAISLLLPRASADATSLAAAAAAAAVNLNNRQDIFSTGGSAQDTVFNTSTATLARSTVNLSAPSSGDDDDVNLDQVESHNTPDDNDTRTQSDNHGRIHHATTRESVAFGLSREMTAMNTPPLVVTVDPAHELKNALSLHQAGDLDAAGVKYTELLQVLSLKEYRCCAWAGAGLAIPVSACTALRSSKRYICTRTRSYLWYVQCTERERHRQPETVIMEKEGGATARANAVHLKYTAPTIQPT